MSSTTTTPQPAIADVVDGPSGVLVQTLVFLGALSPVFALTAWALLVLL